MNVDAFSFIWPLSMSLRGLSFVHRGSFFFFFTAGYRVCSELKARCGAF